MKEKVAIVFHFVDEGYDQHSRVVKKVLKTKESAERFVQEERERARRQHRAWSDMDIEEWEVKP